MYRCSAASPRRLPRKGTTKLRQIAVLPYRFGGPAQDRPTEILLITSRETKRWVVPKGNPLSGMTRHAAAAVEAEEEAGGDRRCLPDADRQL